MLPSSVVASGGRGKNSDITKKGGGVPGKHGTKKSVSSSSTIKGKVMGTQSVPGPRVGLGHRQEATVGGRGVPPGGGVPQGLVATPIRLAMQELNNRSALAAVANQGKATAAMPSSTVTLRVNKAQESKLKRSSDNSLRASRQQQNQQNAKLRRSGSSITTSNTTSSNAGEKKRLSDSVNYGRKSSIHHPGNTSFSGSMASLKNLFNSQNHHLGENSPKTQNPESTRLQGGHKTPGKSTSNISNKIVIEDEKVKSPTPKFTRRFTFKKNNKNNQNNASNNKLNTTKDMKGSKTLLGHSTKQIHLKGQPQLVIPPHLLPVKSKSDLCGASLISSSTGLHLLSSSVYTGPNVAYPSTRQRSNTATSAALAGAASQRKANMAASQIKDSLPQQGRTQRHKQRHRLPTYDSDTDDEQQVDGSDKKWQRSVSLRRQYNRSRNPGSHHMQDPGAHSDTELSKLSETHSSLLDGESNPSLDRPIIRVSVWAASFEKLLEDQAGLHTFAEFLKKEFSHENIYFWTACERYKRISSPDERRLKASDIFDRHLGPGAAEPVNVDSQARQVAQDGLQNPDEFTFAQAQKQIFNLMKFDSYSRFLKSALYKEAEICDMRGHTLPYPGDETLDPDLRIVHEDSHTKLKKSKSDADERRRKSLLPWHRKDRSRSKDRGEAEYRRRKKLGQRNTSDSSSIRSDISESRTSLNSDLANGRRAVSRESLTSGEVGSLSGSEGSNRCRVMLPDLSASVVAVRTGETCQSLLNRLLERRGISYSTFDLYLLKGDKMLDKLEDSSVLGGQEVRIEQRILFRLDFPNRKTVCVKAKPHKNTSDVLKPILAKYGYKLELMAIHKCGEDKSINLKTQVNELDGQRLIVQTKEEVKEWGVEPGRVKKRTSTLDEITNRVFNEVLEGKSDNFDELGVLDIDEKDKLRSSGSRSSLHENITVRGGIIMTQDPAALVTKRRGSNSSNPANPKSKQENDELYEGLKRAQRSRLDDQRGTEINFELPDFLKCDQQSQDKSSGHSLFSEQLLHQLECSFMEGGVIPSHQEAEDYFSCAHPEVWGDLPLSAPTAPLSANATLLAPPEEIDDLDDTILDNEALCQIALDGDVIPQQQQNHQPNIVDPHSSGSSSVRTAAATCVPPVQALIMSPAPPPLPPKPKLGGACARGPPPRPPSRQLHLITHTNFSSNSDDEHVHSEQHMHLPRQTTHDKFNISFV